MTNSGFKFEVEVASDGQVCLGVYLLGGDGVDWMVIGTTLFQPIRFLQQKNEGDHVVLGRRRLDGKKCIAKFLLANVNKPGQETSILEMMKGHAPEVLDKGGVVVEQGEKKILYDVVLMEFFPLGDLLGQINKIHMEEAKDDADRFVLRAMLDVANALRKLHSMGFAHCDIKPENILCGKRHCVLSDFGLSQSVETRPYVIAGTLMYAAPEVLMQKISDIRKTDVFSLGVVLFVFLFGEIPFFCESKERGLTDEFRVDDLLVRHGVGCHKCFRLLLRAMLQQDHRRRPAMKNVVEAMERFLR